MANLAGKTILYTRSSAHFPAFAAKLAALGARALPLPLIDTRAIAPAPAALDFLQNASVLIFTSQASVRHLPVPLPEKPALIAIGRATAALLPARAVTAPAPYTSEALLNVYQPRGEHIAIIAGTGGRDVLLHTLSEHNTVQKIEVYERFNPTSTWPYPPDTAIDAVLIGSVQTLEHLVEIAPQSTLKLLQCGSQIITLSERIAVFARKAGFLHVHFAASADEAAQLATLQNI